MDQLGRMNWISVIVATIVGFGVGAVWFSPPVFAKQWMADQNKAPGAPTTPMGKAMGIGFVTTLLTAIGVAWFIRLTGALSLVGGTKVGLLIGLAFMVTSYVGDAAYAGTPNRYVAITAGHRLVMVTIMGAILGAWH